MQCPKYFDEVKGIIPKCRPQCKLNYYQSKRNLAGCSNPKMYSISRSPYTKPKKSKCKSGWSLKPFTRTCLKKCPSGTSPSGSSCKGHSKCNTRDFSPTLHNKSCKPKSRSKRSHRSSCGKYGVPARIDIANNCMKKCLPGEGETPVGLCVKPGKLRVSPADVFDLIAGEFNSFTVEIASHANLFWTHAFLYLISTNNPHRTLLSHFNFSNT
jgi:hypothetical protein